MISGALILFFCLRFSPFANEVVEVSGGHFRPLLSSDDSKRETVPAFFMMEHAVTQAQYTSFMQKEPSWRVGAVPEIFAEGYLPQWKDWSEPPVPEAPVTGVSWYAANAYCESLDMRLPTIAEWEVAAQASQDVADASRDPDFRKRILRWYSRPNPRQLPKVQTTYRNFHGLWDMHGLIWEWVYDFKSFLVTGESRQDSSLDRGLFCGAAAERAMDASDYAAFMRYGLRSSLQANYTLPNLGFRCVKSKVEGQ